MDKVFLVCLFLVSASASFASEQQITDIEGTWCTEQSYVVGGYRSAQLNQLSLQSDCLEYKLLQHNQDSGVGHYIFTSKKALESAFPVKRSLFEKFNNAAKTYERSSAGLFTVIKLANGQLMMRDQSLSQDSISTTGILDTDGKLKFLTVHKPMHQKTEIASASEKILTRKTKSVRPDYDDDYRSLVDTITTPGR